MGADNRNHRKRHGAAGRAKMKTKTTAYRLVKRYSGWIAYLGFPSYEAAMKYGRQFQDPRIGEIYHPEEYWGEVFRDENGEMLEGVS